MVDMVKAAVLVMKAEVIFVCEFAMQFAKKMKAKKMKL